MSRGHIQVQVAGEGVGGQSHATVWALVTFRHGWLEGRRTTLHALVHIQVQVAGEAQDNATRPGHILVQVAGRAQDRATHPGHIQGR